MNPRLHHREKMLRYVPTWEADICCNCGGEQGEHSDDGVCKLCQDVEIQCTRCKDIKHNQWMYEDSDICEDCRGDLDDIEDKIAKDAELAT